MNRNTAQETVDKLTAQVAADLAVDITGLKLPPVFEVANGSLQLSDVEHAPDQKTAVGFYLLACKYFYGEIA